MARLIDRVAELRKVAAHCDTSTDPDVAEFGRRIGRWFQSGARQPLDSALGLRSRGGPSARRVLAIEDRDRIVRHLAAEHADWSEIEPTVAAKRMRTEFERYEAGRWVRDRLSPSPPAAEPAASFWRILRTGAGMPQAKRLAQIIAREIQYPV